MRSANQIDGKIDINGTRFGLYVINNKYDEETDF